MNRDKLKHLEAELNKRMTEPYSAEEIADYAVRALASTLSDCEELLDENEQLKKNAA